MRILVAQLGEFKSMSKRRTAIQTNLMTLIDDLPLRRNRRQLTDFDSEKQVGRIDVSAATSVGAISCSVLATVDHRR
ncbi:hypothetical protein TNCV_1102761 [Trichonephila clavipes]|nr:hypothetical protein TNCV_1102761 [Trichonephila clavipes]